jgi:hypothetical protein
MIAGHGSDCNDIAWRSQSDSLACLRVVPDRRVMGPMRQQGRRYETAVQLCDVVGADGHGRGDGFRPLPAKRQLQANLVETRREEGSLLDAMPADLTLIPRR